MLCCRYTLTDFPISIRLTSLALWQSNDCPSTSKATLMNMGKYFMWIHYERLHNHNKAKHNKTVCIFLGIYLPQCSLSCIRSSFIQNLYITINRPGSYLVRCNRNKLTTQSTGLSIISVHPHWDVTPLYNEEPPLVEQWLNINWNRQVGLLSHILKRIFTHMLATHPYDHFFYVAERCEIWERVMRIVCSCVQINGGLHCLSHHCTCWLIGMLIC